MKATIYSHKIVIGTANLEADDANVGAVYGNFEPNDDYFKLAQQSIWNFTEKNDADQLKSLRLNIQLANGFFLHAIGGIRIDDAENRTNENPLRIDISGLSYHVLAEYFHANDTSPFVLEPWEALSIDEKIDIENELESELVNDPAKKTIFSYFVYQRTHLFIGYSISALARDKNNGDVLFSCHKPESDIGFAIVTLTWKGCVDRHANSPITVFLREFIDFKLEVIRREELELDD